MRLRDVVVVLCKPDGRMKSSGVPHGGDARIPDSPVYPGAPRWVKAFGVIAFVVVLLVVVLHLTGRGPGAHMHGGRSHDPADRQASEGDHR
jgi:hypothetical protein